MELRHLLAYLIIAGLLAALAWGVRRLTRGNRAARRGEMARQRRRDARLKADGGR